VVLMVVGSVRTTTAAFDCLDSLQNSCGALGCTSYWMARATRADQAVPRLLRLRALDL
jgi:hypothetical protein